MDRISRDSKCERKKMTVDITADVGNWYESLPYVYSFYVWNFSYNVLNYIPPSIKRLLGKVKKADICICLKQLT